MCSRPSSEEEVFADALAQPAGERNAFIDRACGGDAALHQRLVALLLAHEHKNSLLTPVGIARDVAAAIDDEKPGDLIGRYKLRHPLGEGGCGVVYLAEQEEPVRRRVALKVIKAGMDTREVIARFAAEQQALALMEHPGIAKVFDAGTTATGRPFFVMELVRGVPITKFCDEHTLSTEARLELFIRVCEAVQHAHHKGIIHRDLKPSNVLVAWDGAVATPKVIDFGIAKATQGKLTDATLVTVVDQLIGTPAYMSPEQAEMSQLDIDTRSDVYSLGVLLYELLVGRPPFDPRTLGQVSREEFRRIIRDVEPMRPSARLAALDASEREAVAKRRGTDLMRLAAKLSRDLDWVVIKALEKNRVRRYQTPGALAADIARHLNHEPVVARPPSRTYRMGRLVRRYRLAFAAAGALALALLAGSVVSTWLALRAWRAEERAQVERGKAEKLLDFMVDDLRTELAKVGRLDVLEAAANKSMEYFTALDPQALDTAALARHAKALRQIGELRIAQARSAQAMEAFHAAYTRAASAAARNPSDDRVLFERGQAEFWIGSVYQKRGELPEASEWLERYHATSTQLAALDPRRAEWQRELAYSQHNLAVLRKERSEFDEARREFLAALGTWTRMHAADRSDRELQFQMADVNSWLGAMAEERGDYDEAAMRFAERVRHLEELRRTDPEDTRCRHKLADGLLFQAGTMMVTGKLDAARECLQRSRALIDALVQHDPENRRWSSTSLYLGVMEAVERRARGDLDWAKILLGHVRRELEKLFAAEPGDRAIALNLASALRLEAQLRMGAGDSTAGEAAVRAAEIGEGLIREGRATVEDIGECAQAWRVAGEISLRHGDTAAARRHWSRAEEILAPRLRGTRDWRLLDPAARVAALAGRPEQAAQWRAELERFGYIPLDPWPDADRRSGP